MLKLNEEKTELIILNPKHQDFSKVVCPLISNPTHLKSMVGCINVILSASTLAVNSIYNKSDEISDVVKDMDLDALVITKTCLTGNVSDQKIVGEVTPAGYSFHHAARIHKKAQIISYRRYKSIDKEAFLADLRVVSLVLDSPDDVDHLVDIYDSTLRDIVDEHPL
ncbi:hypothetical protein LSH36_505g01065 [Paralvinella palmiformis]|uniref:Uncharacterized protein n=1 Tax=Paralvinella palmiformis TaxID=53620 RepID=A0AAD9MYF1_9ANNE|nr:hypothetical protein LSH36_505g01065 [Paralvinella palmiformis]